MSSMPAELSEWLEKIIGPVDSAVQISASNNLVWRVDSPRGQFTAKQVIDKSSGFRSEHALMQALGDHEHFRPSLAVRELPDGGAFVLTPYLIGTSLDRVLLEQDLDPARAERIVGDWRRIIEAIGARPAVGFGALYAPGGPAQATWLEYLELQLEEQRLKGPITAKLFYRRIRGAIAMLADQLAECRTPTLVPADSNNRNYIVRPDGGLVCINLPALWHGHWLKPWGEVLVHWDGTPLADRVLGLMPQYEHLLHFYAAHQAYIVLVFGERFSPPPLDRLMPWGGRRPLMEILEDHLAKL